MKTPLWSRRMGFSVQFLLRNAFACIVLIGLMPSESRTANVGPDDYGYVATDAVPYAFENISSTGTAVLNGTDDAAITIPIGFAFSFYGALYTNLSVTPNGLVTFGGENSQFSNLDLNSSTLFGDLPSVAVLWDDWVAFPGTVYFQTFGLVGERRLVIQWHQVRHISGATDSNVTFQAIFYETSGVIKFQYADVEVGTPSAVASFGGSATVGLRDMGGNLNGRVLQWSFNSAVIANGQAIQFRPGRRIGPDAYGYTATDLTPYAFEDISGTGVSILAGQDNTPAFVNIGFPFNFYGSNYTSVLFTPNGLLTFRGIGEQSNNVDMISNPTDGDWPTVAVLWDDWVASPGAVYVQTLGSPGSRRFIVQWHQHRHVSSAGGSNVTFQVILYEANHCLKFQYADVEVDPTLGTSFGGSATVGIRDQSGHVNGRVLQWSFNQPAVCNGQAVLLSPWGVGRVAVYGAPSVDSWNEDVRSKIALRMPNIQVDAFLIHTFYPPPTLNQLLQYRSVLVYSDAGFSGNTALGDVLANYVDAGGGVVLATFAYHDVGALSIQGRLKTGGYLPFTTGNQNTGSGLTLVPDISAHPILNGVASFSGGGSSFHNSPITNQPGSELIAHWSNGQPLVGTKAVGQGRVVGLNFYPPSSESGLSSGWAAGTDGGLLMANALKWAGAPTRVVSVFDDPVFVDTGNTSDAESDNLQAALRRLGFTVTTFTDIAAATLTNKVLLFPEQENSLLAPAMSAGARAALSNFVARGGLMIVHGGFGGGGAAGMLNTTFGFSTVVTNQAGSGYTYVKTGAAVGTAFADDPPNLPINNGTSTLLKSSLPAGAKSIYETGSSNAVALIPFGSGKIIFLAYDWWNAVPAGTQDNGWPAVLASAVAEAAPLQPFNALVINSSDRGWYNDTGFHSAGNNNYFAGEENEVHRNFFVFNVPALTGSPLSAELRINAYLSTSPSGSELYELRAVTTPIATLTAGGSGLVSIYNDLGDGSVYGGRYITTGSSGFLTIPLNASFLSALPVGGGQIALGGQIASLVAGSDDETLFGFSFGPASDVQLHLRLNPTFLPAFELQLTRSANAVQLSWLLTPDTWQLQSAHSLSNPVWVTVPDAPAIIGTRKVVVLPVTDGQLFFRLWQAP